MLPTLRERLHDMWLLVTMDGDPVATLYTGLALALLLGTLVLYTGAARAAWQWWVS
jgi:hypothetical protein